jgi:hypothetical protein
MIRVTDVKAEARAPGNHRDKWPQTTLLPAAVPWAAKSIDVHFCPRNTVYHTVYQNFIRYCIVALAQWIFPSFPHGAFGKFFGEYTLSM